LKRDLGSIAKKQQKSKKIKTFVASINTHFQTNVQCTLGQCINKSNKLRNIYNVKMKKTYIKGVPPLDWLWYEQFSYLFTSTTKINGVCQGIDQRIHNTQKEIDVVDFFYKDENVPKT
jgi:hypothetical protein